MNGQSTIHGLANAGINTKEVMKNAAALNSMSRDTDDFKKALVGLAAYIQTAQHMRFHTTEALKRKLLKRDRFWSLLSVNGGYFLPILYLVVKLLNLLTAIGILFILQVRAVSYLFNIVSAIILSIKNKSPTCFCLCSCRLFWTQPIISTH